jgi:hypothetical protein
MRKLLFMLTLPTLAFAGGPKSTFPKPPGMDAEMQNIYHDIANPVINYGTCSSCTITSLAISTITFVSSSTVTNETVTNLTVLTKATVPNGVNSTDAAAYGQVNYGLQTSTQGYRVNPGVSINSTSAQVIGTSVTITPTLNTSRVLITVTGVVGCAVTSCVCKGYIFRGSTDLSGGDGGFCQFTNPANSSARVPCNMSYIDSPASTSALIYNARLSGDGVNACIWTPATDATIIATEIK